MAKMDAISLIDRSVNGFYDLIYKAASAFPYSNDLMHLGLGAVPFLIGKYGYRKVSKYLYTEKDALLEDVTGISLALLAECGWLFLEAKSPYNHSGDFIGIAKGVGETCFGAGAGWLITRRR